MVEKQQATSQAYEETSRKLAAQHADLQDRIAELERMLRQRDDFMAEVSHRLRTPLSAIIGYGDLLAGNGAESAEQQRDYLAASQEAAKAMLGLLADMPALGMVQLADWLPQPQPVNLAVLAPQLEGFFAYDARQKGLEFTVYFDPAIPSLLAADMYRIRQILLILVHNAIRFTERGHVTVSMALQEATAQAVVLAFTVEDSGMGMESARLEELLRPVLPSRRFGRAGNNLRQAFRAVEKLGARLHVESLPGRGSRFQFLLHLPVAAIPSAVEADALLQPVSAMCDFGAARVLVADDHAMNRELLRVMLEKLGVGRVDTAVSGVDAMAKCRTAHYHLLLMDCQMPDMDGFTAARIIKNIPDNHMMPVIGISADVLKADKARCMEAGMEDMFPKPLQLATLEQILRRWL